MRFFRTLMMGLGIGLIAATSHAAVMTEVVTESDVVRQFEDTPPTDNWVLYFRPARVTPPRPGTPDSAARFVTGPGAPPLGTGSLQLTTVNGDEKVFLFNFDHIGTGLSAIDAIRYSTYRSTAANPAQVASLNIQVDYNGAAAGGFTTLVFEPTYNTDQGAIVDGVWQTWTASGTGRWWSTAAINGQPAGATIANLRTWEQIKANNPAAVITGGFGVNQGSGNGGLTDAVDQLTLGTGADVSVYDLEEFAPDSDGDGLDDNTDNCKDIPNPDQLNSDGDQEGDVCDADDDNDSLFDGSDNCPVNANADQTDSDGDGIGDACDDNPNDGPNGDNDGDGASNAGDNCPDVFNSDQADRDGDGAGDACDPDVDGDGVDNGLDNCIETSNPDQADQDGNNVGDACDPDIDGDGIGNGADNCQTVSNPDQANLDGDGDGDACDEDRDGDGVANGADNCSDVDNPGQADADHDGIGDACDPNTDVDGDGIPDASDHCPNSDLRPKVDVNGAQPGVTSVNNTVNAEGCSIQDLVNAAAASAKNHGQYVSAVGKIADDLQKAGVITKSQANELKNGAAQSNIGK